ncbi:Mannose-1-phosphate guanylyltransferase [hydrothermal vent metagenome]|uniref:Mannose-1-phosphate guanylyltransferase n=1 Tax=hydrothermal vent metagenome TaxID=652676 RepID=A0A1W1EL42_9ZZZZ
MKAVILSGGEGKRVRPLTYILPKPMVPIVEKPLISYIFEHLKKHNFLEVIVTVSYKADVLEAHYQNGEEYGMQIAYSLEGEVENGKIISKGLGSAGGLKQVQNFASFFDEPFLVICGDALIDLDLTKAMNFHNSHNGVATVICKEVPKEEVHKYGVVVTNEDRLIKSFQEKPKVEDAKSNIVNTGIYIFDPIVLDYIPDNEEFDIGGDLLPLLNDINLPYYAKIPDFQWIDVGSTADFYKANMLLLDRKIKNIKPYGKEIKPNLWVGINCDIDFDTIEIEGVVYIGNSVKIEKGVKIIGPTVIGSGSYIKENVILDKSILFTHTKINGGLSFSNKIITSKYIIKPDGSFIDIDETKISFLVEDARSSYNKMTLEEIEILKTLETINSL